MNSVFRSENSKGGVLTNKFAHIEKSKAFANNREISKEDLVRLNESTMKKKMKMKPLNKG